MADGGATDQAREGAKQPSPSDKLPRAHKRCVNKDCREILSLATKVRGVARPGKGGLVPVGTCSPRLACDPRLLAAQLLGGARPSPPCPCLCAVLQKVQCSAIRAAGPPQAGADLATVAPIAPLPLLARTYTQLWPAAPWAHCCIWQGLDDVACTTRLSVF